MSGKSLRERLAALSPAQRELLGLSLGAETQVAPTLARVSRAERHPLTTSQQQIWLETQLNPDPTLYNEVVELRLDGPLEVEALRRAAAALQARHEAWRTRMIEEGGRVWQVVDAAAELPWTQRRARAEELDALRDELARATFDLARGPVFAMTLVELGPRAHVLILVVHHIAFDGQSAAIYVEELVHAYEAFSRGREPGWGPLGAQQLDLAVAEHERERSAQLDWWAEALDGAPNFLDLPTDAPRSEQRAGAGARRHFELGPTRSRALRGLARELGASPFAVLVALLGHVLRTRARQDELVLGTPMSVRGPELAKVVGVFLNTVPLRLRGPEAGASFADQTRHAREVLAAASERQVPLPQLLARLGCSRLPGRTPLFEVLVNLYKTPPPVRVGELVIERQLVEHGAARFDLALDVEDCGEGFSGWWEYDTALFRASTIERIHAHLWATLDAAATEPGIAACDLPRMSADEAAAIEAFSDGGSEDVDEASPACIHTLFDEQVARTPDAVALITDERRLSYSELARRAWGLARVLVERGVQPGSVVGVCADRSIDMVVAVLAVLEAGAGYLPLDPAYPAERLVFMLEDSDASLVIGHRRHLDSLPGTTPPRFALEAGWDDADTAPRIAANPEHLAYVTYTSGSTGRPNGVLGLHRGMVNRFRWMWRTFPFAAGEVGSQKTALSFLDSCWEMFGPLLRGVPVAIVPEGAVRDPRALVACLARHRATRLVLVPSLLAALLDTHPCLGDELPDLRVCVCSGEALPLELIERAHAALPRVRLVNLYGSSETSADTAYCVLEPDQPRTWTAIGRPITNTHAHVVDEALQPRPIGVPGELCIAGIGLARGYWQRPELSARRFVANPFPRGGPTLHHTGDLARWRDDGMLEYLGRVDQQIKVRGFRVEPGEIERALTSDPAIDAAIVGLRNQRLIGWYASVAPLPVAQLRARVAETLPNFMIPSHFVHLDRLPHTPSGKVDRHRLPLPSSERGELGTPYERPRTELERTIARVWAEHLGLDRVGVLDNFFELGGHSLLLVQIYSALALALARELTMMELFRHPTVRSLAHYLEPGGEPSRPATAPRPAARLAGAAGRRRQRASTRRAARAGKVELERRTESISLEACDGLIEDLIQRVLGDELGHSLGPTEVFFTAGGTPEQASRAIARLNRVLEVELPARALLQAPTARQLGLYVQAARREPRGDAWRCTPTSADAARGVSELRWEAAVAIHGRVDEDVIGLAARTLARHHPELGPADEGWRVCLTPGDPVRLSLSVSAALADPSSTCALLRELLAHAGGARPSAPSSRLTIADLCRWREAAASALVARGWPRVSSAPPSAELGPRTTARLELGALAPTPAELSPAIVVLAAWTELVGPTSVVVSGREHGDVAGLIGPVDGFVHVEPADAEGVRSQLLWGHDHRELGDDMRGPALFWAHTRVDAIPQLPTSRVEPLGPGGWQARWPNELHLVNSTLHVTSPRADVLAERLGALLERGTSLRLSEETK
ncbi:Tyrocidine synthase 3 [Enhygromyxa salina]|uniref:Tyrocidine synthase 3 n=1 Tax=Enhygromyxa salina TaxID=215803 RepID=A0A2S9XFV5_9BACT|nr:non-ribosomal peptide synthetase [Enhygromyxa salina]PRP91640.1 Tyrocidine synthase 3 [Enhygromyxa salina]